MTQVLKRTELQRVDTSKICLKKNTCADQDNFSKGGGGYDGYLSFPEGGGHQDPSMI